MPTKLSSLFQSIAKLLGLYFAISGTLFAERIAYAPISQSVPGLPKVNMIKSANILGKLGCDVQVVESETPASPNDVVIRRESRSMIVTINEGENLDTTSENNYRRRFIALAVELCQIMSPTAYQNISDRNDHEKANWDFEVTRGNITRPATDLFWGNRLGEEGLVRKLQKLKLFSTGTRLPIRFSSADVGELGVLGIQLEIDTRAYMETHAGSIPLKRTHGLVLKVTNLLSIEGILAVTKGIEVLAKVDSLSWITNPSESAVDEYNKQNKTMKIEWVVATPGDSSGR